MTLDGRLLLPVECFIHVVGEQDFEICASHKTPKEEARGQGPEASKTKAEARRQRPEASNTKTDGRQGFAGLWPLTSGLCFTGPWPLTPGPFFFIPLHSAFAKRGPARPGRGSILISRCLQV